MVCRDEKLEVALAAGYCVTALGANALANATPAQLLAMLNDVLAGVNFGWKLDRLAGCLENNGQPQYAQKIRDTAQAIDDEVEKLKQVLRDHGVAVP